jgi:hypothetical protein
MQESSDASAAAVPMNISADPSLAGFGESYNGTISHN